MTHPLREIAYLTVLAAFGGAFAASCSRSGLDLSDPTLLSLQADSDAGSATTGDAGGPSGDDAGPDRADAGPEPPSCAPGGPGMTNCGDGQGSCCASLEVPGGTFYRTYANAGTGPEGEADPATVSSFRLDEYDVTVGRFRQFVKAWNGGAGYTPPAGSGKHVHLNGGRGLANVGSAGGYEPGWVVADDGNLAPTDSNLACGPLLGTWTSAQIEHENLPINCVNWYEAYAFCIWDGGFLPSEAEREYAAAGGSEQREYPWGSAAPGSGNQYAIYYSPAGLTPPEPVGTATLGVGRWGHFDLAGDVDEWELDWYSQNFVDPCVDCAYLSDDNANHDKLSGGGSFDEVSSSLLVGGPAEEGNNEIADPTQRFLQNGFRCARVP